MDTKGRLIAGSNNRNEFVLVNADEVSRGMVAGDVGNFRYEYMILMDLEERGRKLDRESPSCFADAITNLAQENSSIKTCVRIESDIPLVELLEFFDGKELLLNSRGLDGLPRGIIHAIADLELRPLWSTSSSR